MNMKPCPRAGGTSKTHFNYTFKVQQFFFGWDYQFSDTIVWNFGIGQGATKAGNRSVLKMRLGWMF